jgi:hypothetical protein
MVHPRQQMPSRYGYRRPMLGYQAEGDDRRELVKPLLERFTADAAGVVPLVAL